jgi:hypothetical protein
MVSVPEGACHSDVAFVAVTGAFVDPTPKDLALGLNELTYGVHPITFVLSGARQDPVLTASYTSGEDGVHSFPPALTPVGAAAWVTDDGFGTSSAQEEGWMLVSMDTGPLEVPLRNISVTTSTEADCTRGTATMTAVIPGEHADLIPRLSLQPESEDETEEERDAPDATLHALFTLELVDFDRGDP